MNKGKSVLINLLAIAKYDHMPDYPIQFITRGTLFMDDPGKAVLEYTESQQDDATGEINDARIVLSLEKKRVTMTREGDYSNTMVFAPDQRFESVYRTPYGDLNMAVSAGGVHCDVGEEKGSVHLKYQLNIQGAYASTNELHLEYAADGSENAQ